MTDFWFYYPILQNKLQKVCMILEENLTLPNFPKIQQALLSLQNAGGKMLRPALFLLFAEMGEKDQQDEPQILHIAASLEILHMATLIHDDIIDDSPLRRGVISLQAQYGKDIAVYTGDLLFTQFFEILANYMSPSPYLLENAQAMRRLLLGELNQMRIRYQLFDDATAYFDSITGKTAELFRLACKQGAHFGKLGKEWEEPAGAIGQHIGLCFQILDDILDYTSDNQAIKKPVLEDLAQGIYTLPLLLAKKEAPEKFDALLAKKEAITPTEVQQVVALISEYGGVEKAQKIAQEHALKAQEILQSFPTSPTRKKIDKLIHELLKRAY